jgi:two-component system chemotaxis sensor kinase CheA
MTDPAKFVLADIDREALIEFLDDSLEGLDSVGNLLVQLEKKPDDLVLVNSIFRPVHSIKGSAAFFGFGNIQKLAHELETILDMLRKQTLAISPGLTEVLLAGVDGLREMFGRVRQDRPEVEDESAFLELIEHVKTAVRKPAPESVAATLWANLIAKVDSLMIRIDKKDRHLVTELEGVLSAIRTLAPRPAAPAAAHVPPAAERLRRKLGTPFEGRLPDDESREVLAWLEELRECPGDAQARADIQELVDAWHVVMNSPVKFDDLLRGMIVAKIEAMIERSAWTAPAPVPAAPAAAPASAARESAQAEAPAEAAAGAAPAAKTMRVSEEYIDAFLEHVGELLVVGDMFNHVERRLAALDLADDLAVQFRRVNETFATLSGNLQKRIMHIRKVPVKNLLQKVPRLVRDIAVKAGKDIAVALEGGEVEVDKSLTDLLDAPLTHMVRNAADHGIEPPDARAAAGKDPKGRIRVAVEETDAFIVLTVQDDGRGLNHEAIRAKAAALGLIAPNADLREEDIVEFIFQPGVSTAEKVTDVSGRGVGMDVVKRMIDESGGAIHVSSEPGRGSTFQLQLPKSVTTQIMSGFIVRVAGQAFVLPMEKVAEAAKVEREHIRSIEGKGRCVVRHGNVLPLFTLAGLLGLPETAGAGEYELVVTLTLRKKRVGLVIDDVLGVQQVVLRSIEGVAMSADHVSGGALMGDGSIALVLDPEALCREGG